MAGTTDVEAIANIMFLTALEYNKCQNRNQRVKHNYLMNKLCKVGLSTKVTHEWAEPTSALCARTASTLYATIDIKTVSTWVDKDESVRSGMFGFLRSEETLIGSTQPGCEIFGNPPLSH